MGYRKRCCEYLLQAGTLTDRTPIEFVANHTGYVHPENSIDWISYDGGENYNLCHC